MVLPLQVVMTSQHLNVKARHPQALIQWGMLVSSKQLKDCHSQYECAGGPYKGSARGRPQTLPLL